MAGSFNPIRLRGGRAGCSPRCPSPPSPAVESQRTPGCRRWLAADVDAERRFGEGRIDVGGRDAVPEGEAETPTGHLSRRYSVRPDRHAVPGDVPWSHGEAEETAGWVAGIEPAQPLRADELILAE